MPNRILRETICTSETINELSPQEEVFFYRLIVVCDDYGLMDGRLKILDSRCYPLRSQDIKLIEGYLKALARVELIIRYEVDGKPYLKIKNWEKYQQIRAKRTKYPKPPSDLQASDINCEQTQEYGPENPIQSESNPNPNPKASRFALPPWVPAEAWQGFDEMRRRSRKPWTDRAKVLIVAELEKLKHSGCDPGEVLNQSVANGWAGVFELKGKSNGSGNSGKFNPLAAVRKLEREALQREAMESGMAERVVGNGSA